MSRCLWTNSRLEMSKEFTGMVQRVGMEGNGAEDCALGRLLMVLAAKPIALDDPELKAAR
ncbi:hypothetical protein VM1G_11906 [Cytospora mali]|uniref:Uncharacterized protein n=1 Tax=Cytospora mali TaxID=578113 RepID=A0A194WAE3_CYTMA|nr:hypothetical protein VM1G_11906 [Valsa mali]